jgi:hypothetical protein
LWSSTVNLRFWVWLPRPSRGEQVLGLWRRMVEQEIASDNNARNSWYPTVLMISEGRSEMYGWWVLRRRVW